MDAHRVRRLRWRARASIPAEAFALRSLLREQGDACQAALDRAFDGAAPAGEVWRLPRLALTIRVAALRDLGAGGLSERVETALRAALTEARQALRDAGSGIDTGIHARPDGAASTVESMAAASSSSRHPPAVERRLALRHYLATGLLPWTLAGLASEQAQRALQRAAAEAVESVRDGRETLDALLPRASTDARIGALLRWLPLLSAPQRRRWLATSRPPSALDATTTRDWRTWIDDDAADRIEWQALWLAGPLEASALRAWIESRCSAPADGPPFLAALQAALAAATRPARTDDAVARSTGAPQASPPAVGPILPWPQSVAIDASPESLLVPLAGLVLLHPWLTRFLAGCGVLDDTSRQIARLPRACALLHALACGDTAPAEHQLPFVKLLLGRPPDQPLNAALPALTASDGDEISALLAAVREHWSALRGTAADGLRLSFLQRRGLLVHADAAWQLRMQGESFDLLLGLLPWSIGLVRLPWMPEPLVVEWPTP